MSPSESNTKSLFYRSRLNLVLPSKTQYNSIEPSKTK